MNARVILSLIGVVMMLGALVFLGYALTHPEFGSVFYIGDMRIGSSVWRAFYLVYLAVTVSLFVVSFLLGKRQRRMIG